jgi:hypothetical protein
MGDKMKENIIKYLESKKIEIPNDDNELLNLYFGTLVVNSINYWFNRSCDFVDNENPKEPFEREWSEIAKEDKMYRKHFMPLDNEVKIQLKKLFKESLEGVIFSVLQTIDEMDNCEIKISKNDLMGIINKDRELHEDLYNWINLFK